MLNRASPVLVDLAACDRLARLLARMQVPGDREESELPGIPKSDVGNFYLALVAICHQTSPRGMPPLQGHVNGVPLRGWDYLAAKLEEAVAANQELLDPECWAKLSAANIRRLFVDEVTGDRLTDPEGRAALLRDLGKKMRRCGWHRADDFYANSHGNVAGGPTSLLAVLRQFTAYSDPVAKKSSFFLALMRNCGLWKYRDEHALPPPVDYHEVRGHLRIGTVRIVDTALAAKVRTGTAVSAAEDIAIRRCVGDAIVNISTASGIRNPSQLHYLFWNVFRSVCTRDSPQCFSMSAGNGLPRRYRTLILSELGNRCLFAEVCTSAGTADPICEHVVDTHYY
jgi:hypothetical protein